MAQIDVSPESMHTCSVAVAEDGNQFGRAAETLRGQVGDTRLGGTDELGRALLGMDRAVCPDALDYYIATSEAVVETAKGIDQMDGLYASVEQDNTQAVNKIIDDLGTF